MGDQAVPAGHDRSASTRGSYPACSGYRRHCPTRYTTATPDQLATWIGEAKATLGHRLMILGHHYQRDEVMTWADARGDSFGLSRIAAEQHDAEFVVFCGVHFMAESADLLTGPHQQVILPDLNAGCSMADMADIDAVEEAWDVLAAVTDISRVVPVTYMNSSAALKAFVGRHGGAVCTSSNARAVLTWALGQDGEGRRRGDQVLFFPDQHLGRNTGFELGYGAGDMAVWDPRLDAGRPGRPGPQDDHPPAVEGALLGPSAFPDLPRRCLPGRAPRRDRGGPPRVLPRGGGGGRPGRVHRLPSSGRWPTPRLARCSGWARRSTWSSGWTMRRRTRRWSRLDPLVCPCSTMFRIDAAHLAWVLDGLVDGEVRNRITVDGETASWARVALERMLTTV